MLIRWTVFAELISNLSTDCGASLILPQPTTSDEGDDCSLEINETTNLTDNASSWGAVANPVQVLFIPLPKAHAEDTVFVG